MSRQLSIEEIEAIRLAWARGDSVSEVMKTLHHDRKTVVVRFEQFEANKERARKQWEQDRDRMKAEGVFDEHGNRVSSGGQPTNAQEAQQAQKDTSQPVIDGTVAVPAPPAPPSKAKQSTDEAGEILDGMAKSAAEVFKKALDTGDVTSVQFGIAKTVLKKAGLLVEEEQSQAKSVYDEMSDSVLAAKVLEASKVLKAGVVEVEEVGGEVDSSVTVRNPNKYFTGAGV